MTTEELEAFKGITEIGMEVVALRAALEAVTSERDFLRALVDAAGVRVGQ